MKKLFLHRVFLIVSLMLVPIPSFAAMCPVPLPRTPGTLTEVLCLLMSFITKLLPMIIAATLVVFFWGLAKMIRNSGDTKAVEDGRRLMFWGVIAFFVMVSFVGILNLFLGDFFGTSVGIPQLPEGSGSGT